MSRVFVGNLEPRITERDLEDEFRVYGVIRSIWVARRPPGYSFIDFDDRRDAEDAIWDMDGKHGWRVELSHKSAEGRRGVGGRGRDRYGSSNLKCYKCTNVVNLATLLVSATSSFALEDEGVGAIEAQVLDFVKVQVMAGGATARAICLQDIETFHLAMVVATADLLHILMEGMVLLMGGDEAGAGVKYPKLEPLSSFPSLIF